MVIVILTSTFAKWTKSCYTLASGWHIVQNFTFSSLAITIIMIAATVHAQAECPDGSLKQDPEPAAKVHGMKN